MFQDFWLGKDDLPFNYVSKLRNIITKGLEIAKECDNTTEEVVRRCRQKFFCEVADELNSPEIADWFRCNDDMKMLQQLKARHLDKHGANQGS